MRQEVELTREEALRLNPGMVERADAMAPEPEIRYVLAWAVGPDGVSIPGPGEPDADMVRAWAENAVSFQFALGRRSGRTRVPRPRMPVPDIVVDTILRLARSEHESPTTPAPALMARVADRLMRERVQRPEPEPAWVPPAPAPSWRR